MSDRITEETPKIGGRVQIRIQDTHRNGKRYRTGWRVGVVAGFINGRSMDLARVRLLDGSVWSCALGCVRHHGAR
jgi:hypothetical protein